MRHPFRSLSKPLSRPRWAPAASAALVVGIEAAVIAALVAGLSLKVLPQSAQSIVVDILHPQEQKPAPAITPPNPTLVTPQPAYAPPPDIRIKAPPASHAITATSVPRPPISTAPVVPHAPAAPGLPAPTPARGILATHTIPPYPEAARRLGQQGECLLKITVGADGSIASVTLVKSSGSTFLDQAALDWVKAHWRYHPATQDGRAIVSTVQAEIVFNLRNAH
jgi:protein TonB